MKLRYMVLILILLMTPWVWNAVKFSNCDFESDYKCEVIHGIGVGVPPAAYVTVWFDTDE